MLSAESHHCLLLLPKWHFDLFQFSFHVQNIPEISLYGETIIIDKSKHLVLFKAFLDDVSCSCPKLPRIMIEEQSKRSYVKDDGPLSSSSS